MSFDLFVQQMTITIADNHHEGSEPCLQD